MKTEQELFHDVIEAITAVLNVKADQIQKNSKLIADLGAESIDFLDISYELEKRVHHEIDLKKIVRSSNSNSQNEFIAKQELSVNDIISYLKNKSV